MCSSDLLIHCGQVEEGGGGQGHQDEQGRVMREHQRHVHQADAHQAQRIPPDPGNGGAAVLVIIR